MPLRWLAAATPTFSVPFKRRSRSESSSCELVANLLANAETRILAYRPRINPNPCSISVYGGRRLYHPY